ncbi:MAG: acylneuraminate cytidylyltransferase family protein [Patescibacteria group bacterium]|nr:acylneuraminate cytidylyltransferase family protein [Patescibacteria group bacterium]
MALNNKKFIAIIPARGGSKRFSGKNIYPLNGKPLISYAIEAAKKAKLVDRVIVSTDNIEIAEIAKQYGAEIPFMRPDYLATDLSPSIDTIRYTLEKLAEDGYRADYVVLLQPTSPLISADNLDEAIDLAIKNKAGSVVAVVEVDGLNHPYNIREIQPDGTIKFWQDELHYEYIVKPKEKPKFYYAGGIWVSSFDTVMKEKKLESRNNYPLIISKISAMDIDKKEDLELIELFMKLNNNKF